MFNYFVEKVDSGELDPFIRSGSDVLYLNEEKDGLRYMLKPKKDTNPPEDVIRYKTAEYFASKPQNIELSERYWKIIHHSRFLGGLKYNLEKRLKKEIEDKIREIVPPGSVHREHLIVNIKGRKLHVRLLDRSPHWYNVEFDVRMLDITILEINIQ